jgi:hypothetical protein
MQSKCMEEAFHGIHDKQYTSRCHCPEWEEKQEWSDAGLFDPTCKQEIIEDLTGDAAIPLRVKSALGIRPIIADS